MERIADEGCNLNISRYISTAQAEKEIDLTTARGKLAEIETRIQNSTRKHNEFLKRVEARAASTGR